jgi:hypothetical protein
MSLTTNRLDPAEQASGVSWGAIAAGAVVAAAFSLALIALEVGLGLSAISPWGGVGKFGNDVQDWKRYVAVVAVLAPTVGGCLAARLRTK